MIKNYIKIAWRNLIKNRTQSFINITGLSVGMACSLLIMLWVQDELSVDAYHKNGAQLYRIYEKEIYKNSTTADYDTPPLLATELKKTIPEVRDAVMLQENNHEATLRAGEKVLTVQGTGAGDGLFNMFSYPLLQGSVKTALGSVTSMAISKQTAEQFFGSVQNAMGKTIRFDNKKDFTVSAVYELPVNTSRKFDYAISWQAWLQDNTWANNWVNSGPLTCVWLRDDANFFLVEKKLKHFLNSYNKGLGEAHQIELHLQKFDEGYLHSNFKDGEPTGGRIEYVHLFSIVAFFILLIACINFMNLSTARSVKRAREVGVRKAVGALRFALVKQFMIESFMLTMLAVGFGFLLSMLLLPLFNELTQKQMQIPVNDVSFWLKLIAITIVTGLVSGSYPALFLSSFNPVKVLKGTIKPGSAVVWLRKILVVFQFVLSLILIVGTLVVSKQVNFIQTLNLGYDRENLVYVSTGDELASKYAVWKNEALNMPGIKSISQVSDNPSNLDQQTNGVDWEGRNANEMISVEHPTVGYDFIRTMKLKMTSGRDFDKSFSTDKDGFIINETAAKRIGYTNALGRTLTVNGKKGTIIGVVKDFHFRSVHEQIQPMIIQMAHGFSGYSIIRTQPGKTKEAVASLELLNKRFNPVFPLKYSFSDQEYQKLYQNERVVSKLSNVFAVLAVFISCLGLLGLVMFMAEQRTKEIGVRKVLGAGVKNIVALMLADFLKLVFIAIIIGSPIAWLAMRAWLNDYAYKTSIGLWVFVFAGVIAVSIALFAISFQSVKAALANPVKSLRRE